MNYQLERVFEFLIFNFAPRLRKLEQKLDKVLQMVDPAASAKFIGFYITIGGQQEKVEDRMALKYGGREKVELKITNSLGGDAKVDGVPQWSASPAELLEMKVSEDGMSAEIKHLGKPGSCELSVLVDADLGEGVKPLIGKATVDLSEGEAVKIDFVFSELQDELPVQPEPAEPVPSEPAPSEPAPSEPAPEEGT